VECNGLERVAGAVVTLHGRAVLVAVVPVADVLEEVHLQHKRPCQVLPSMWMLPYAHFHACRAFHRDMACELAVSKVLSCRYEG
jgi:hypothetical protein